MQSFTEEELAKSDGIGGNPAYAVYKGKVYDLSAGPNWVGGEHFQHLAGQDLTEAMQDAPHGDEAMGDYPVVGELTI